MKPISVLAQGWFGRAPHFSVSFACRRLTFLGLALILIGTSAAAEVSGDLRLWHKVTLTVEGPATSEDAELNPFCDFRMDVHFTHADSGHTIRVPGYFAADGNAAHTSATAGNRWRAHLSPNRVGQWHWRVSFRTGQDVATADDPLSGEPWAPLDGSQGSFLVGVSDKHAPDLRGRGTLEYVGERYLRFAGDGRYFLKGGVDSPETLLGYADIDGTYLDRSTGNWPPAPHPPINLPALKDGVHRYQPHLSDWQDGDPVWKGDKGKGLIGGLNYLATQGVNSVYFLTMNVNGDGRNVWPWIDPWKRDRFDCSKLDQWEIIFSHMTAKGMMLHVVTQETENDHLLDGGELGAERKLYYRELIARFSHHPAITWNLGEENVQSTDQRMDCASFLRAIDPYAHHIVIHNDHWHARNIQETFEPLLGFPAFTGPSLQDFHWNDIHTHVKHYVRASADAGHQWVVMGDEMGGANFGTLTDADDPNHDDPRRFGVWGTLMAGGAGVELYFGWQNNSPHSDLSAEDWRPREGMYRQMRIAREFFEQHLPYWQMEPYDDFVLGSGVFALAQPGKVYCLYLPNGAATRFDLGPDPGAYEVKWFNPRTGGALLDGSTKRVRGPGLTWTGYAPENREQDWVVLVRRIEETAPPMQFPGAEWTRAEPMDLGLEPAGFNHALNYWRMSVGENGMDELVVVRRGVVVHSGPSADRTHNVWSVTKSFTSSLLGLLIADGSIALEDPAARFEPTLAERYPSLRIRHFATMTSGYNAEGRSRWGADSEDWSANPYQPGVPLFLPGSEFAYWDEAQMMFARVLTKAAGRDLFTLLRERILSPIGATAARWQSEGEVDGVSIRNGATGLEMNAFELARFGHLMLNQGRWGQQQLIPADWVATATRERVPGGMLLADTDRHNSDGRGAYGYNWWVNGTRPDGARFLPDAPEGTFIAIGLNHNIILVVPEWEMVIVRTGTDRNPPLGHPHVLNHFLRRLGAAVYALETEE